MYPKIKWYYPELINFFFEYNENSEYLPSKKYMWDNLSSKNLQQQKFHISFVKEKKTKRKWRRKNIIDIWGCA